MKITLILFCVLFFVRIGTAQITLEHVYDSSAIRLYMVDLEISGKKYVEVYTENSVRKINFYNLDHTPWKSVNMSTMPIFFGSTYFTPLYFSETLFNNDNNIEFLYVISGNNVWYSGIYNEFGACLTPLDSMGPYVTPTVPTFFRPIYNTPMGTKLIMSHMNGDARVYSLPGTLTTEIQQTSDQLSLSLFPNPNDGHFKIKQNVNAANKRQVTITDMNGTTIEKYTMPKEQSEMNFNLNRYSKGIYIVKIESKDETIIRKIIVE